MIYQPTIMHKILTSANGAAHLCILDSGGAAIINQHERRATPHFQVPGSAC
jgi:hypothetical protein